LARASAFQAEGRGFESRLPLHFLAFANLAPPRFARRAGARPCTRRSAVAGSGLFAEILTFNLICLMHFGPVANLASPRFARRPLGTGVFSWFGAVCRDFNVLFYLSDALWPVANLASPRFARRPLGTGVFSWFGAACRDLHVFYLPDAFWLVANLASPRFARRPCGTGVFSWFGAGEIM
jgi:hypothetical protein